MHDLQVRACIKRKECTKTIWWHTSFPYMQNKKFDKFPIMKYDTPPPLLQTNYVNMQDNYVNIST